MFAAWSQVQNRQQHTGKRFQILSVWHWNIISFSVVVINLQKIVDRTTGLFTMTSSLQYMPTKEDVNAKFSCIVTYYGPSGQKTMQSEPVVFDVHCKLSKSIFCCTKSTSRAGESKIKNSLQNYRVTAAWLLKWFLQNWFASRRSEYLAKVIFIIFRFTWDFIFPNNRILNIKISLTGEKW